MSDTKELVTFRMYAGIRFNREIDKENDFISPGGFEFTMGNRAIQFDFNEYEGTVNSEDGCVLDIMEKNPDYDTFHDLEKVTEAMLSNVIRIGEFYVHAEASNDSTLVPIALEYCKFVLPYENWKVIDVPDEVLKTASLAFNC